jgi:hypothetical protein
LILFSVIASSSAANVACQEIKSSYWSLLGVNMTTCVITAKVEDTRSMIQPRNSSTQGLILSNPSNSFLPVNVSQTFDGLIALSASGNKLPSVSKENFSGLARLRLLDLSKNKIKRIQNNTFEDLLSLEVLDLSE